MQEPLNYPLVSIIMPVYNAYQYVSATIESVLHQTYKNFELILIDDGATDGSGDICDKYAEKDLRISVIHQKNGGICAARNRGLLIAKGKYVAFCDHDDIYKEDYLERTVFVAESRNSELVKFTYRTELWNHGVKKRVIENRIPEKQIEVKDLINQYKLFNYTIRGIWNGIYLKRVIDEKKIRFDEKVKFGMEDYIFNLQILENTNNVTMIPDTLFIHFARFEQSTSEKYRSERYHDIVRTEQYERRFLKRFHFYSENWIQHQSLYLILYLRTLTHPENTMTKKEKCCALDQLNQTEKFKLNCNKLYYLKLLVKIPKDVCISFLFHFHLYKLLLLIYEMHRKTQLS